MLPGTALAVEALGRAWRPRFPQTGLDFVKWQVGTSFPHLLAEDFCAFHD